MTGVLSFARRALPKNRFARGVSVLVGGTAGSQLLIVLASPVLTRLYVPSDFGLFAVFTAVLAGFTVVASGRYELAVVLPVDDRDAAHLVLLALLFTIVTTLLSTVLVFFFASELASLVGSPALARFLWLVPLGVLLFGTYQVFMQWAVRAQSFKTIAGTRLWQAIATVGIQLAGFKFGAGALMAAQVIGQGVGGLRLANTSIRTTAFRRLQWSELRRLASRYRRFPIYSMPTGLLNTVSLQFAPLVFAAFYGAGIAGLYALTLRTLTLPMSVIGSAVGSVFLSHGPQARRDGRLSGLIESLHSKLATAGAPPLILLLFTGPDLFALIFGEQWRQAGSFAQWMAPWIYLQFQWSPFSHLSTLLELQHAALVAQGTMLAFRLLALAGFAVFGADAGAAMAAFAVASAGVYLLIMLWFFNAAGARLGLILIREVKILLTFLAVASPAVLVTQLFGADSGFIGLVYFAVVTAVWYARLTVGANSEKSTR